MLGAVRSIPRIFRYSSFVRQYEVDLLVHNVLRAFCSCKRAVRCRILTSCHSTEFVAAPREGLNFKINGNEATNMKPIGRAILVTMSRGVFFVCCAFLQLDLFAQKVTRMDPYEVKYEPGVVLVKFAEDVVMPQNNRGGLGKVIPKGIQETLAKYGVEQVERLFPQAKRGEKLAKVHDFSGQEIEVQSLFNIFRLKHDPKYDSRAVAEELSKQEGVIYAEPDYIFTALETIPNDALYSQQWYLPAIQAPAAWDITTGDTTQLIGIIDTGVDWDHPDLADKIKFNWTEYNGVGGVDDDGNGYVDDIRGWDFVNNDNNPNDDNGHGTHVAGIAAAETNNGTGIAGVSWGAKLLPVKVLQSSGYGSSSTIAQGVDYARVRGANVINLSLGSYTESLTLKTALENASSVAVIVAAAGNDGIPIEGAFGRPMFPACYSWVIGVQATDLYGGLTTWSNFDPSGPVTYNNSYGYNYEMQAPGVLIYSTLPNGLYGSLSGTSMSTAVVSGAVALLKSQQPNISNELMLGNLINSLGGTLDVYAAMNQIPKPDLRYISYGLVDTLAGCDRDGIADAGETLQIWLTLQNVWGRADSTWTELHLGQFEDPTTANIIKSKSYVGDLSAYATSTGAQDPFKVQIASNVANDRDIVFETLIGCKGSADTVKQGIVVHVENGRELSGVMDTTLVLTPEHLWLVLQSFRVATNGKLIIKPGTTLKIGGGVFIDVKGQVIAKGTADSNITITSTNGTGSGFYRGVSTVVPDTFVYCNFKYLYSPLAVNGVYGVFYVDHCLFDEVTAPCSGCNSPLISGVKELRHSIVRNIPGYTPLPTAGMAVMENNVFFNWSNTYWENLSDLGGASVKFNNFVNLGNYKWQASNAVFKIGSTNPSFMYNNIIDNDRFLTSTGSQDIIHIPNQYWGGSDGGYSNQLYDFWNNSSLPMFDVNPVLSIPDSRAHGIVWKVELNNVDPQEQHLDPIGAETLKFDVYFNRAMNISYTPLLTFGVRDPCTQHIVANNASWNSDSTIWTSYFDVGIETGDGINTIRVASAKDDENFEIPIENTRFKFTIQAAGAASNQFIASAGVGKVTLEWPKAPTEDALGYNMYRYYDLTDSTFSPTGLINSTLIRDTTYTDFAVIPGTRYHYAYKVLGTDLAESDYSKFVVATPVKASSGDANGDGLVNVLDVVAIVDYILGENPQPFISEAADVNDDSLINVLDIVGVVNKILGLAKQQAASLAMDPASLLIDDQKIILNSPVATYALQFTLKGNGLENCVLSPTTSLKGFEIAKNKSSEQIKVVIYTLGGQTIPAGLHQLFSIEGGQELCLTDIVLVDRNGNSIPTTVDNDKVAIPERFELFANYPNPFNPQTNISFALPKPVTVRLAIYNILGQKVKNFEEGRTPAGIHELIWDGRNDKGITVSSGVYFYRLDAGEFSDTKKMLLLR
jgi:subtilisin family serine protease